jgi:hypothetical protein
VKEKIQKCQQEISKWNGSHKGQTEKLISQKTKRLEELQDGDGFLDLENIHTLQQEVNDLLEQEDLKWRQRAKENWLRHGDKNSKYFHACANQRRRTNQISRILDEDGRLCTTQDDIEQAFTNYFQIFYLQSSQLVWRDVYLCYPPELLQV